MVPPAPVAYTCVASSPHTSSSVFGVPLSIGLHVLPSKCKMTPAEPTANTSDSLEPQRPTIVSRVGVGMSDHAPPVHRMMTPSWPPANTDVGPAAQTASSDTSVSPCRSTPQLVAGPVLGTTVMTDVALREPSVAVTVALPLATAVTTPAAVTVTFDGSDTVHFGVSASIALPSALRPKN